MTLRAVDDSNSSSLSCSSSSETVPDGFDVARGVVAVADSPLSLDPLVLETPTTDSSGASLALSLLAAPSPGWLISSPASLVAFEISSLKAGLLVGPSSPSGCWSALLGVVSLLPESSTPEDGLLGGANETSLSTAAVDCVVAAGSASKEDGGGGDAAST